MRARCEGCGATVAFPAVAGFAPLTRVQRRVNIYEEGLAGMRITAVHPILSDQFLLVRVATDAGLVGNGEAGLWASHEVVARAIESLAEYFVGQDPARIEHHHQAVTRASHFMGSVASAALSAIDVALWDIAGKVAGLPVHRLLGGPCRDRIKVFENVAGDSVAGACRARPRAGGAGLRLAANPALFRRLGGDGQLQRGDRHGRGDRGGNPRSGRRPRRPGGGDPPQPDARRGDHPGPRAGSRSA